MMPALRVLQGANRDAHRSISRVLVVYAMITPRERFSLVDCCRGCSECWRSGPSSSARPPVARLVRSARRDCRGCVVCTSCAVCTSCTSRLAGDSSARVPDPLPSRPPCLATLARASTDAAAVAKPASDDASPSEPSTSLAEGSGPGSLATPPPSRVSRRSLRDPVALALHHVPSLSPGLQVGADAAVSSTHYLHSLVSTTLVARTNDKQPPPPRQQGAPPILLVF